MFEAIDDISRTKLASRETNGITVRLLWSRATNLVTVAVDDAANDDSLQLILDDTSERERWMSSTIPLRTLRPEGLRSARRPAWEAACPTLPPSQASSLRTPSAQRRFVATTARSWAPISFELALAREQAERRLTRSRAPSPIANMQPDVDVISFERHRTSGSPR